MRDESASAFVQDGYDRWLSGTRALVYREVAAQYAKVLQGAGFWRRWRIHLQIKQDVDQRMQELPHPSPESLF